jgi:hypothetical protein
MKGAVKARLVTFDGFTYDVQTVKQKVADADKYYLTVAVSADIAKERAPVKDEKAEDKKKNDEAFAEEKKKKEEKLANEKKLAGWVYEVTEYTVSSLLKSRPEVLAAPEKKADAAAPTPESPVSGLPNVSKMLEGLKPAASPPALTPASPLPEAPKTEIKPAPAPDANPLTGEKPTAAEPKK